MPKATKNIPAFAGGEISKYNPRDIPDEALSKAQDVMMDKLGMVRLMGRNEVTLLDSDLESIEADVTPGYGLYTFRADKHIRLNGEINKSETHTYNGTAYTRLYITNGHKFVTGSSGAGANIYVYGSTTTTNAKNTAFIKRHKILTVISETSFVIDLPWSQLNEDIGIGFKFVWNPGWGERPYYDSNGIYCNEADADNGDSSNRVYSGGTVIDNPVEAQPIDGDFVYIAIQDQSSINLYHYTFKVLISHVAVLTDYGVTNINPNSVKPNIVYVNNALRLSDGKMENSNNSKVKWFGYTSPKDVFITYDTVLGSKPLSDVYKDGKSLGNWNVYNGSKTDLPGVADTSDIGYVESYLEKPKDILINGNAATFADYSGLQFQVSQYTTRDSSKSDAFGGVSSLCNGTGNPGSSGTQVINPNLTRDNGIELNEQTVVNDDRKLFPGNPRQIHMVVSADNRLAGDWQGAEEHAELGFGMAWVYGTKTQYQESKIFKNELVTIKSTNSPQNTAGADAPSFIDNMSFRLEFFVKSRIDNEYDLNPWIESYKYNQGIDDWGDPRLIGASIYITKDADGELDDPLWLGTVYIDSNEGFIDSYGNKFNWGASFHESGKNCYIGTNGDYGGNLWNGSTNHFQTDYTDPVANDDSLAIGCAIRRVPTLTYKLRNFGLEPYDADQGQQARWKTSVFAQNRLFVGNVQFLDGKQTGVKYPDRMLISPEVKYDSFPHDSYIDVQTNDGDQIVKLEYYKGKLLQFKRNILYIIDISGEFYFNEATHQYIGIKNPWSSTVTPGGIAWVNNNGLFIYEGSKIVNLIDKKISDDDWFNFCGGSESTTSPMITYIPKEKQIIVAKSPAVITGEGSSGDVYIYDVETESFTSGLQRLSSSNAKSNFTIGFNDKTLYGVTGSPYDESPNSTTTTSGTFPTYARGSLEMGGGSTTNAVTFQYYKGDSSWTSASATFSMASDWSSTNEGAQNAIEILKRKIGHSFDTAVGDLFIEHIEGGVGVIYMELRSKNAGTTYNTGNGDETSTGYNSFKFTGSGTDWTTTTDSPGTNPDIGTTNGITSWLTHNHMSGGSDGTAQVNTVTIDREGSTQVGVTYKMNLVIYNWNTEPSEQQVKYDLDLTYNTVAGDNSNNNLAVSIANVLQNIMDNTNNNNDNNDDLEALSHVTISTPSSGSFTITSSNPNYKFKFEINISGQITLEQFNSTSKSSRNMLIHTKEYDFAEPNVRKKIYKFFIIFH